MTSVPSASLCDQESAYGASAAIGPSSNSYRLETIDWTLRAPVGLTHAEIVRSPVRRSAAESATRT